MSNIIIKKLGWSRPDEGATVDPNVFDIVADWDPSDPAGRGCNGTLGSIYRNRTTGQIYKYAGPTRTDWVELAASSGDALRVDFFFSTTAIVATNMAAGDAEFPVGGTSLIYRRAVDLTGKTEGRLCLIQNAAASSTSAKARVQYATTIGGSYADLDVERAMHNLGVSDGTHLVGSWSTIATGGRAAVFLRIMLSGGNGTSDPSFYAMVAEFR